MSNWPHDIRGGQALLRLLRMSSICTVLDVGSGVGDHALIMRKSGLDVKTVSLREPADFVGDFLTMRLRPQFDALWACHVLEHQVNPGLFLAECRDALKDGGYLFVTVPPAKHEIVGGHVTLWNAGLLLYQLILAGLDCRHAAVGTYGYNISVIVRKGDHLALPKLDNDCGDIERLAQWFPLPVAQGFDGELPDIGWQIEA